MAMRLKLAPLAAFLAAAVAILDGAVSTSAPYVNGAALVSNLKTNWPVYLGVPVGVGIAGSIAKGMRANPGISFGKAFSVRLF